MSIDASVPESLGNKEDSIIDEIRELLKSDEFFAQFMGVEMQDLDRGIAPLIYALWKTQLVKTRFSCEGHIGHSLLDGGIAKMPGHMVYVPGHLIFENTDQARTNTFLAMIEKVAQHYPFVSVGKSRFSMSPNDYLLTLSMEDIRTKNDEHMSTREVQEDLAQERIALFKKFWKELALVVWSTA